MKKLIVVSVMLALVLGLAIWEILFVRSFYSDFTDRLDSLQTLVAACDEKIENPEIERKVGELNDYWERHRDIMMLIANHNVMRTIGDKVVSLSGTVEKDNVPDTFVNILSLKNYIRELKDDLIPIPSNVF